LTASRFAGLKQTTWAVGIANDCDSSAPDLPRSQSIRNRRRDGDHRIISSQSETLHRLIHPVAKTSANETVHRADYWNASAARRHSTGHIASVSVRVDDLRAQPVHESTEQPNFAMIVSVSDDHFRCRNPERSKSTHYRMIRRILRCEHASDVNTSGALPCGQHFHHALQPAFP
jgi:hypothetical protein